MTTPRRVYARPYAYLCDDDISRNTYTLNKEYEVLPFLPGSSADFLILGDDGSRVPCWWNGDPDVLFERIER